MALGTHNTHTHAHTQRSCVHAFSFALSCLACAVLADGDGAVREEALAHTVPVVQTDAPAQRRARPARAHRSLVRHAACSSPSPPACTPACASAPAPAPRPRHLFVRVPITTCITREEGTPASSLCLLFSANIWLDTEQLDETLSTLKFAQRMMNVPVEPVVRQLFNPLVSSAASAFVTATATDYTYIHCIRKLNLPGNSSHKLMESFSFSFRIHIDSTRRHVVAVLNTARAQNRIKKLEQENQVLREQVAQHLQSRLPSRAHVDLAGAEFTNLKAAMYDFLEGKTQANPVRFSCHCTTYNITFLQTIS